MIGPVARVMLTGGDLTLDQLLAVARGGAQAEIAPSALGAMARARDVADRALTEGRAAYGVSTGVGSRKLFDIARSDHDRLLVRQHRISQGKPVPHEVVRYARQQDLTAPGATAKPGGVGFQSPGFVPGVYGTL